MFLNLGKNPGADSHKLFLRERECNQMSLFWSKATPAQACREGKIRISEVLFSNTFIE